MQGKPPTRRRFIAGARCPSCGAMDKIVVDLQSERRSCIACDFSEERPPAPDSAGELATRVSRPAARRVETAAEPVTLLDPDRGDGSR